MEKPDIREEVRARYAEAARAVSDPDGRTALAIVDSDQCCAPSPAAAGASCCATEVDETPVFGPELYSALDRDDLPVEAVAASLGCGNPLMIADLHEGEVVLDLGSGGGIDVLLSAKRVGGTGHVYGLDMTEEMLELARANAARAGATNAEFLQGVIEDIPLPAESVDVVISNCVVNLSPDKPAVFAEVFRVLRPGGRIGISDVVAEDDLSPEDRAARGSLVGCIAGALSRAEYVQLLGEAGFVEPEVTFTHQAAPQMHGAVVRARKPTQGIT